MDLLVGSGGNEKADQANYKNRLYLNNGKGIFTKSTIALPTTNTNVAVIAPYDFDNDGDNDVSSEAEVYQEFMELTQNIYC